MDTDGFIAIAMSDARIAAASVGHTARERILIATRTPIHSEGIRATGVDRIANELVEAYRRRIHETAGSRSGLGTVQQPPLDEVQHLSSRELDARGTSG
jgi:hypothetical protein